jgi:hypothetical protein
MGKFFVIVDILSIQTAEPIAPPFPTARFAFVYFAAAFTGGSMISSHQVGVCPPMVASSVLV